MHIKEAPQKKLFADIRQNHQLKHVKISHDASLPFIPKDIHIKETPQKKVLDAGKETFNTALSTAKQVAYTLGEKTQQVAHALEEKVGYKLTPSEQKEEFVKFVDPIASPRDLEEVKSHLKPAQTQDKSKPVIENDVHIKENHHKDLLAEIGLKHDLNHVKTTHDASLPLIDKDIHIKETTQKKVLDAGKEKLNTAITTAKQVAYTIGEQVAQTLEEKVGYKLTPSEKEDEGEFVKFVDPLASPRDLEVVKSNLKHAQTRDKSKPIIDRNVHIKENHHKDLFVEIEKSHDLHHVKATRDASSPVIDKGVHIKEAPQKAVLSDITQHHQLKHVAMNDKSAPVIPRDVHIKMLIE